MKFAFFTLGCKVNLFETQALSQLAQARGHEIVDKDADAVIVNTCTVTSVSDHKNIRAFHKLRRDNPNAVIAALLVGIELRMITHRFGRWRDKLLGKQSEI